MAELKKNEALRSWLRVARAYQKSLNWLAFLLKPLDITVAQFDVLAGLSLEDGVSQQALARRLYVSKANLSGLLKRLAARNLVKRNSSSVDGRVNLVYLTQGGRKVAESALKIQQNLIHNSLGQLEIMKIRNLGEIMNELSNHLDSFPNNESADKLS